ncbi:actin depolymerizing protein [Sistotremastrum suecicum HHB10207 ss-3]|uniref:Twinfilin n=1 Tax=Sistotremastrum suecicum HHB10207 ss-3 TaxID=1314776 RepID=A0A166GUN8_9AGAM|nr:actin depolymerizing protein [Sistotremastrum suecicum HHB10207 ss-3]
MSASSGILVSQELADLFVANLASDDTRFIKVSIKNESLVPDTTISVQGQFEDDLEKLQDILEDSVPAYILARKTSAEWIAISYIPDTARVRDKMLYASTRASLARSLGSSYFAESIFATSKADLTASAYAAHLAHAASPQPLSAREQEMEDLRAAERASGTSSYAGSASRINHIGTGVGLPWSSEAEQALQSLTQQDQSHVVVLDIDLSAETVKFVASEAASPDTFHTLIPTSAPSFAFFLWIHERQGETRRDIFFVYSCPTSSPIKSRMIYASGAASVSDSAKQVLGDEQPILNKFETSDPKELNEHYINEQLGWNQTSGDQAQSIDPPKAKQAFARPKGPGRRK